MVSSYYAQVSQQQDLEVNLAGAAPARTSTFTHIEEARALSWDDAFYDGKHGIVAAFDRDTHTVGQWFLWKFLRVAFMCYGFSLFYWIMSYFDIQYSKEASIVDDIFGVYMLMFGTFVVLLALRGRQAMRAQHLAISTEGVRVDNGAMVTVTIPFEHIHKCESYPSKYCFFRSAGFHTIALHRSAAPLEQFFCTKTKKLELYGVIRSEEFVELVMAMKDSQDNGTYEGVNEARVELVDRQAKVPVDREPVLSSV
jgi:hypothetical protein